MNLALLIGRFPPGVVGGAEVQAEQWAAHLGARHRVTVITRRDPPSQPERETRERFEVVRLAPSRVPLVRTLADLGAIERTVRALPRRPDLVLCFQTFISGLAGVRLQRRLGVPAAVWIRGEGEIRLRGSWIARTTGPGVWDAARGVLVQSREIADALLDELRPRPALRARVEAKLEIVPNGIVLPPESRAARGGRILAVGRLIPEKGMDLVIDAVAGMQGLLTVAGDGPERARLEERARRHGVDASFEGFVDRARLSGLYGAAAAVVLASRRGEGLPNVVLEAMAHGCAVVVTRVAGIGGLVRDGENGLVVPPGDALALRDALARLANERGLAARLGAAARATAERYAWDAVVPRLESVLERWGRTP